VQVTPFKDQGYYTEIHNALLDVVMPALKPTSWVMLCAIIRQTKGWRRETCPLSVSNLMALCGFGSRHTVIDCLAELRAFRQGARTISLIIEYAGQDQWSAKSYGLNRDAKIEWEPTLRRCGAKNASHSGAKNASHSGAKNAPFIRKEENHVREERWNNAPLSSLGASFFNPSDSFDEPLPPDILKAEISKICGCAPINGNALKIERAAVSIVGIGGTIELLREYVRAESDRIFKVEFIASDFGGWLARQARNGANGKGSHSVEYCPACAGAKRAPKVIDGRRRFVTCTDCDGTGRKEAR
jgi:hypothetical protein